MQRRFLIGMRGAVSIFHKAYDIEEKYKLFLSKLSDYKPREYIMNELYMYTCNSLYRLLIVYYYVRKKMLYFKNCIYMLIYAYNQGAGFGNVAFGQLGAILFAILFDGELINITDLNDIARFKEICVEVDDEKFLEIINAKLNNNQTIIDTNKNYFLKGYYQHDECFALYKQQIIDYIRRNPDNILFANHYSNPYKLIDVIKPVQTNVYDVVIHLRLGDFIGLDWVMHPHDIKKVVDSLNLTSETKVCLVLKPPTMELEYMYISYLQNSIPNLILEMNSYPMIDYNIMRNARILVCSCSTLSWIASFMGCENQQVYFPNYETRHNHETYRRPHEQVVHYEFRRCTGAELFKVLNDGKM